MSSLPIPNLYYICGVDSMVSGMNFVHHISRGFRDISGGYTPFITHTMAHELGHGIFGLDHIFSGAYGIKKGATYNLMDYTEKTPNDALSYHEWNQINLPLPSWSALSRAEEDMWLEERVLKAGEFVWEGDWLCGYYPDELEEKVNDLKPLFDHIRNNYASYWKDLNSKKKDLDVNGFGEWSVRKFSIKEAICKSLYEKLSKKGTPSFDLHEEGIFLQPYVMNVNGVEKSYEVSVYSFKKNVEVDCNKFKLQDLSDLADHQNVKAAYCNEYGLVALYDEGKNLNMIIQVWSKDGESPQNAAINWLNYLNIVSQSGDADAKAEENKKQTDTKINESNPTGWSIDKCKQLVQRMYDNLSEWAKGLLPEEDLPVVWGENKSEKINIDIFLEKLEEAVKMTIATNPTGNACNKCSRNALYLLKNDSTLFPYEGSAIKMLEEEKSRQVKGYTTNPGLASNIKADFNNMKFEYERVFEEVVKNEGETWQDYFIRLQNMANSGDVIVGAMMNSRNTTGHIIIIAPGEMADVRTGNNTYLSTYGKTYVFPINRNVAKVPLVIECGQGKRESNAPLCTNVDYRGATERLKWYRYKQ